MHRKESIKHTLSSPNPMFVMKLVLKYYKTIDMIGLKYPGMDQCKQLNKCDDAKLVYTIISYIKYF